MASASSASIAKRGRRRSETQYWDIVAREWEGEYSHSLWRARSDAINSELLRAWLPNFSERLLKTDLFDEYCGRGLLPMLMPRAQQTVAIDLSAQVVAGAARDNPAASTATGDVRRLPFADETFDTAVSISTLDHFSSRAEIAAGLRELERVLQTDGELILTLDNQANPLVKLRRLLPFRLLNWMGVLPYRVGVTMDVNRARQMLEELNFKILDLTVTEHSPRVVAVLVSRVVSALGGAAARSAYLSVLSRFEGLSRWPTRFVTGHYIAFRVVKRGSRRRIGG